MNKKIPLTPAMLEYLINNVNFGQDQYGFFATVPDQVDRKVYDEVAKIFSDMKGKWNSRRHRTEFLPGYDPIAMFLKAQKDGFITVEKDGYFPTPAAVVKRMIELADIRNSDLVLEPSAGTGAIANCLVESGVPQAQIHVIEFNEARREILRQAGYQVVGNDFLEYPTENSYSVVIMNPPFENAADVKHVMKAVKHLKPKGILVAVVGAGFAFRKEYNELKGLIHHSEKLPDGAFSESGTNIGAYLVVYRNDPDAVKEDQFAEPARENLQVPYMEQEYESPESILKELMANMAEFNTCMLDLAKELGMSPEDMPLMPASVPVNMNEVVAKPAVTPKKTQRRLVQPSPQMSLFQ